ncbi:hypothetical protein LTR84_011063 [Exophiala bonariae]|uniref:SET domain-containing protein n=1 Tax=Exophiala bonariae TaxID=1690606 RepID=A0AAV9NMG9_9EURO|nr:hypothetical protein LTR84_011063 [Exophiala bonariae]
MEGSWVRPWQPSVATYDEAGNALLHSYIEHHPEFRRPSERRQKDLKPRLRSATAQIHQSPYQPQFWLERARILLKLWYPELAASDCYKAYLLLDRNKHFQVASEARFWQSMSDAKFLLAQALFFANCFYECANLLKTYVQSHEGEVLLHFAKKALARDVAYHNQDEEFQNMETYAQEEQLAMGEIITAPYPWAQHVKRRKLIIDDANKELDDLSDSRCVIEPSPYLSSKLTPKKIGVNSGSYGVYATEPISNDELLFEEATVLCGIEMRGSLDRCYGCASDLSTLTCRLVCRGKLFCSRSCVSRIEETCDFPFPKTHQPSDPSLGFHQNTTQSKDKEAGHDLLTRVFATTMKFANQSPQNHPLNAPLVVRLMSNYSKKTNFSLSSNIIEPIDILKALGVDIFSDTRYESWVVQTILARIEVNSRQCDPSGPHLVAINSLYCFFNHSCSPNVKVEDHPSGSSELLVSATRDIKPYEELCITYLDEDQLQLSYEERRKALWPWTGGDCRCDRCDKSRQRRRAHAKRFCKAT